MTEEERNVELSKIKSSNELLEECKEKVLSNDKLDEKTKKDRISQIDEAIDENYKKARSMYGATKKEVESSTYGEVSEEYKEKYKKRLKTKNLTDEELHQKEQAVVIIGNGAVNGEETKRKRHRRVKNSEISSELKNDIEGFEYDPDKLIRLDNEEELMKSTMVKDNKDLERRRHRSTNTVSDTPKNPKIEDAVGDVIETKKIKERDNESNFVQVDGVDMVKKEKMTKRVYTTSSSSKENYKFDSVDIPSYIQYDILPLPSNGECYSHKKSRIPVAYLTAADEDLIASPNMYRDGNIIDVILKRKILDKSINVDELCSGDRDAIILWLRATGYGPDFPIEARHPITKKVYPINVKLDSFKYYPFNLNGDENGYFDYTTDNGDLIKFKYLGYKEEEDFKKRLISLSTDVNKMDAMKYVNNLTEVFNLLDLNEHDKTDFENCIVDIKDILNIDTDNINFENSYYNLITTEMVSHTVSVNGNDDREFVKGYIDNMRAKDALAYREYVKDNTPGVNFNITVNVPQSDGGGTFATFLKLDDYVFITL